MRDANAMTSIRRWLYGAAWALYTALILVVWALRTRLPERLPSWSGEAWTDRDAFFGIQFAVLGLVLLFSEPIDRVLLRRSGESAFMAAITVFVTLVFALILLPVIFMGLSFQRPGLDWILAASLATGCCAAAYLLRMRTLRDQSIGESMGASYYRKIRPGWLAATFPLAYPFLPFSIAADAEGIRVKGALMDCRWRWGQVESVAPGRAVQAYAGMAIRLTASGRDVMVVGIRDLKWPIVLNAPDRPDFFESVRRLAPQVKVAEPGKTVPE